ncbi:MAG: hypothetical protein MI748_08660 [Opitutales bacterium]|nr:hypothetical protein [Opitutales bacterium]
MPSINGILGIRMDLLLAEYFAGRSPSCSFPDPEKASPMMVKPFQTNDFNLSPNLVSEARFYGYRG